MQARFLIGPAGSGKTFRCLAEIRAELRRDPAGLPLLLLAPKQATFQLERQLLADVSGEPPLTGFTRLQILSFDRLAQLVLDQMGSSAPGWLDDEGRVMVLRALLAQQRGDLKLFHATARLPGFATRLSALLRELQNHQLAPRQLLALAGKLSAPAQLCAKLHDFALLLRGYQEWLLTHQLYDADTSLDLATEILRQDATANVFRLGGLWLDGFAELTGQELDLLAAVVPRCERAALAFCLPQELDAEPSWLSPWAVIGQTYARCRQRLADAPSVQVAVETLSRAAAPNRFTNSPELDHLEANWSQPTPHSAVSRRSPTKAELRIFTCANPEAEAVLAAREIRRHVRAGGRYRQTAVLVRSLEGYADTLRRVFARYEIPIFLDRRAPVAHHPLAELTRYALRTVAFGWRRDDWFGALKTGLAPASENEVDRLENIALENGWQGNVWQQSLPLEDAERVRLRIVPPFAAFAQQTAAPLNGRQLAAALRELWQELGVEKTLEHWSVAADSAVHQTVWEQMQAWLGNLELAFPTGSLPVREWLPILEAGLASLTVGVIPPALDQVLVGAIDRSRNPDLKLALVLGLNEGVFPAPPTEDPLLNELERDVLATHGAKFGFSPRQRIGHEWFYGYIACTRASERLVLTGAETDARGRKLNRSPFFDHLRKIFPALTVETFSPPAGFGKAEHLSELVAPAVRLQAAARKTDLLALPELTAVLAKARQVDLAARGDQLSPAAVESLYGRELKSSVSALENFAACPFRFFIGHGLRAQERKEFELDARERGSFQHELLKLFQDELDAQNLRWRDLAVGEARARIRCIGEKVLPGYLGGLFAADAARRFTGELLLGSLETCVGVLVGWARDYQFDPVLVETGFGLSDCDWPAWRLDLEADRALLLRGRVDRVDVLREETTGAALVAVVDYKSGSRRPDRLKLYHGLQLQLPAYLAALEQSPEARATLKAAALKPAGVFYVNLRGEFSSEKSRAAALADAEANLRAGFQHAGRYDEQFLSQFDPRGTGEQFKAGARSHDRMDSAALRDLLDRAVTNLKRFGAEIFSGKISPAPFRKGGETACGFCDYASICRFDPWTQPFRPLAEPEPATSMVGDEQKPKRKKAKQ